LNHKIIYSTIESTSW